MYIVNLKKRTSPNAPGPTYEGTGPESFGGVWGLKPLGFEGPRMFGASGSNHKMKSAPKNFKDEYEYRSNPQPQTHVLLLFQFQLQKYSHLQ